MINLIHGDCLEKMKDIPDQSVDMCLTDPPYGTTACKWDSVILFEPMWEQLHRILKPNGAICLFGSEPFSSALRMSNIKRFKYDWIYQKTKAVGYLNANRMPISNHEVISCFYIKPPLYQPQMSIGVPYKRTHRSEKADSSYGKSSRRNGDVKVNDGYRMPTSVIKPISNPSGRGQLHPTQKPVALLEYLIKTYTLENETVFDFTMGSGSTGVACKNLNRKFIGIEKDDNYFEIAKKRISGEQA
jgi:DNA modification methylase